MQSFLAFQLQSPHTLKKCIEILSSLEEQEKLTIEAEFIDSNTAKFLCKRYVELGRGYSVKAVGKLYRDSNSTIIKGYRKYETNELALMGLWIVFWVGLTIDVKAYEATILGLSVVIVVYLLDYREHIKNVKIIEKALSATKSVKNYIK